MINVTKTITAKSTYNWAMLRDILIGVFEEELGRPLENEELNNVKIVINQHSEGTPPYSANKWSATIETVLNNEIFRPELALKAARTSSL
jgi:hypothetical protein